MTNRVRWLSAIRVLGLLLVLIYHIFRDVLPGGFLGVDVFFTLSGYLITMRIIEQYRAKNEFALLPFYGRRLSRVLPPLLLAIAVTLPLTLFISPDFTAGITKQFASAVGFVSNFFEIRTGGTYEAQLLPHLYVHTWTLSVEVHFYLAWGFFCLLASFLAKLIFSKNGQSRVKCFTISILSVSAAAAVASYLFMRSSYQEDVDTSYAYFNTFSHAFPYLIGSAAAAAAALFKAREPGGERNLFKSLTSAGGLVATLAGITALSVFLKFNDKEVFEFGFLLASLLTVAAIYCARSLHDSTPAAIKEPRALSSLADMSIYIYLLHWPIFIVMSNIIENSAAAAAVTIASSLALSAALYYLVDPIIYGKPRAKTVTGRRLAAGALTVVLLSLTGLSVSAMVDAPDMNSIEESILTGFILVDRGSIEDAGRRAVSVNATPVTPGAPLEQGLLPAATVVPSEEPSVESSEPEEPDPETGQSSATTTVQPSDESGESGAEPPAPPQPAPTPPQLPQQIRPVSISGGVTIIGDSVCLGAVSALREALPGCVIDAEVSRQISAGHRAMINMQNNGSLRECVVIALGTNTHSNYAELMTRIVEDLEPGHRLVFVTPYDGRSAGTGGAHKTAVFLRGLPSQYSFVTIADWNALIGPQQNLLTSDKVHIGGPTSANLYANCVAEAVAIAKAKPPKGGLAEPPEEEEEEEEENEPAEEGEAPAEETAQPSESASEPPAVEDSLPPESETHGEESPPSASEPDNDDDG